jgi:hypothetical protein
MGTRYIYKVHVDYFFHNGLRIFDFKNKDNRDTFSSKLQERLQEIVNNNPGWEINSHNLILVGDVLALTVFFQQPMV